MYIPCPGRDSYKLWHQYLRERRSAVEGKCITDPACQIVVNAHERALVREERGWDREEKRQKKMRARENENDGREAGSKSRPRRVGLEGE